MSEFIGINQISVLKHQLPTKDKATPPMALATRDHYKPLTGSNIQNCNKTDPIVEPHAYVLNKHK